MKILKSKNKNIETFKQLSFKDKLDYLWDYYKIQIIAVISGIALVIYILYLAFRTVPEEVLNVTMINSAVADEEDIKIDDEFLLSEGYNLKDYQVSMGGHITIDDKMSGTAREMVGAMILAEEIDVLVWDNEADEYIKNLEANINLKDYMPEEYIDKYSKYAVYSGEVLIGFSFDGTKELCQELLMKESYLGIATTATNKDEALRFMEYLLDTNYGE